MKGKMINKDCIKYCWGQPEKEVCDKCKLTNQGLVNKK